MRLRKIELKEKREHYILPSPSDLSWHIPQRLVLWFDAVSSAELNELKQLLTEHYPLTEKERYRKSSEEPKVEAINYGKGCFPYEFLGELRSEESNYPPRNPNLSHYLKVDGNYTLKDARNMKERLEESAKISAHCSYLEFLSENLKKSSGARIWVMGELEGWHYSGSRCYGVLTQSPEEAGSSPFQPSLVEAVFFPPRQEVLRSLMGLLVEREAGYETPRHQEILEGILKGNITAYHGHAGMEFEKQKKDGSESTLAGGISSELSRHESGSLN
ncbi:hypothetical protein HZC30_00140 [Candidatus Woesearchaeota archaeon]|nr:hypothetical protein [Candidatus Woesearchaeota archaeon]